MQGSRILVVEDDWVNRTYISKSLDKCGYVILDAVTTGEDAVQVALESKPDLVLMDINLEGEIDGIEAAALIQEHIDVPVVYLTGLSDSATLERARITGPFGYLVKPIKFQDLKPTIEVGLYKYQLDLKLREKQERLKLIHEIDMAILRSQTPQEIAKTAAHYLRKVVECERVAVSLLDMQRNKEVMLAVDAVGDTTLNTDSTLDISDKERYYEAYRQGKVIVDEDLTLAKDQPAYLQQLVKEGIHSSVTIPLVTNEQILGVIYLDASSPEPFTEENLEISRQVASSVAVFLHHANLHIELQQINNVLEERVSERTAALEKAMREVKKIHAQLVASERLSAIGELAAGVVHELRNPLSVISASVDYLKRKLVPDGEEKVIDQIERMERQLAAANHIIDDLLGYTRTAPLQKESINLNDHILNVLNLVNIPDNVDLQAQLDEHMPQGAYDPQQINRLLFNLINNAVEAMPQGGELKISSAYDDRNVWLTVEDTGVGIPPENIERLFDPLFTTRTAGTGLGLAICRRVVDNHEGAISVESEEGKGSKFIVRMPLNPN